MGIQGLSKLIGDYAPGAVKENDIKNYFGRKVAIDASMSIYQFLIAVRQDGSQLTNEAGETTSHLMGMFYRTIRMIDHGIKPVYVFDGKPPHLKSSELSKRSEKREEAEKCLQEAVQSGDVEAQDKFSRRTVKVTKEHTAECKKLLTLMGVPYVEAPCEAEAQCAALVKAGAVYATGTEDMDSLTFGSDRVLRHLTFSEARKMPIKEFHLNQVLKELHFTQEEFIDLCILLGCDYTDSIRGIGPKRAIELVRQHRNIDAIMDVIDVKKYPPPEEWLYKEARELFKDPEVQDVSAIQLKWSEPDEEELVKYMAHEKSFSEERIRNGVKKLKKARQGTTQGRLDSFFKVTDSVSTKRKADPKPGPGKGKTGAANKKAKTGGGGKFNRPK